MPDLSGCKKLKVRRLPEHLKPWEQNEFKEWPIRDNDTSSIGAGERLMLP